MSIANIISFHMIQQTNRLRRHEEERRRLNNDSVMPKDNQTDQSSFIPEEELYFKAIEEMRRMTE